MTHNFESIGKRIKKARENAGLSKASVARSLDFDQYQTVYNWEEGKATPSIKTLLKLCDLFDCDLGYLVGEYSCPRMDLSVAHESLGLAPDALSILQGMNENGNQKELDLISEFITFTSNYPSYSNDKELLVYAVSELVSYIGIATETGAIEKGYMWEIQDLLMCFIKYYIHHISLDKE